MKKIVFIIVFAFISFVSTLRAQRYVGGDISLLPEYQKANSIYKDSDGKQINELLPYLYDQGMNAMRVRLFVNPDDFSGHDPNACQDLPYIIPLCKEIMDNGFDLILDFHYSDTWADPAAQWIPHAWEGLSEEELVNELYDYTRNSLITLKNEGIIPAFIQPGNEISYGMLWSKYGAPESNQKKTFYGSEANWQRLGTLLKSAISACREVCPEAGIILHTERVATPDVLLNFYSEMRDLNVNYDIIGLSYYPYFHGNIQTLDYALVQLEQNFPEHDIMIVETGFPYKWEIPGTTEKVEYEYSAAGQNEFARQLVDTLLRHDKVRGLFWWWMEFNAFGTQLDNWYNAPLFDSLTGMALPALKTICSFGTGHNGIDLKHSDPTCAGDNLYYDIAGRKVLNPTSPGIYIINGRKIMKGS